MCASSDLDARKSHFDFCGWLELDIGQQPLDFLGILAEGRILLLVFSDDPNPEFLRMLQRAVAMPDWNTFQKPPVGVCMASVSIIVIWSTGLE